MSKRSSMTDIGLETHPLHSDIGYLRRIGQERGFPARLRRKIWTILLQCDAEKCQSRLGKTPHEDEKQVLLDTNRSFTMALPQTIDENHISSMKVELQHLISQVLRSQPWLHYYQGYHDIAQLMYLVLGSSAEAALERLSLTYLRDFMLSSLNPSMSMLRLVHQIVQVAEPDYASSLHAIEPYYAIPVLLTWWTHSLESHEEACRMFDFLLSSEPVMIIYTIAAATLLRREEVMELAGDADMIFLVLSRGVVGLDLEKLLRHSTELYESIKPRQLQYWKKLSAHSCLKTFAEPEEQVQTPEVKVGDEMMQSPAWAQQARQHSIEQETELEREKEAAMEAEKKKKKQSKGVGVGVGNSEVQRLGLLALGVGFLAVGIAWFVQHRDAS